MRTHLGRWLPPLTVVAIIGTLWGSFFWLSSWPDPERARREKQSQCYSRLKIGMTGGQVEHLMGSPNNIRIFPVTEGMASNGDTEWDEWDYAGCGAVTIFYTATGPYVTEID